MKLVPLPDTLKVGDKIVCNKYYVEAEVLEVFKVDGERVWVMRDNGNAVTDPLTVELLKAYDYEKIVSDNT